MADKKLMTKEDLAEELAKDGRMMKGEALKAVELIFTSIAKGLIDPEYGTVKVAGFGAFTLVDRPARVGVNPSNTGEKINIPASKAVKFKPSKTLKDLVNKK